MRVLSRPRHHYKLAKMSSTPKLLLKNLIRRESFTSGKAVDQLQERLTTYFGAKVFVVNSGRSAIFLTLKALGIGHGDEVLIQAYTCNAVPNPVLWSGAVPVYVDIDEHSLNMSLDDLKAKITPSAKAIIVQHTFGNPAKIREILKIAEQHKLKVIEDCAHSLGARLDNRLLGTFGDMAIVSFGREKVISSLSGGALIVNDPALVEKVDKLVAPLKVLPKRKILQEIGNYFSWRVLFRRIYNKNWGSNLVRFLYQFDVVNVVTSQKELSGLKPAWYPSKLPDILAKLALQEFDKLEGYNSQRAQVAEKYFERLKNSNVKLIGPHPGIYLRVVGLHPRASSILAEAKKRKLSFGNWYNSVVYPEGTHLARLGYRSGSCPVAEQVAAQTINLPNYLGMTDIEVDKVISFLKSYG